MKPTWRNRKSFSKNCTGAICFTQSVRQQLHNGIFSLPKDRIRLVDPPIDTERFSPPTGEDQRRYREQMGIPKEAYVVGIVARMQTHRRFGPLLDAVRIVANQIPQFRFIIIGRGTHQEKVAQEPVRKLGLENTVLFAGYRSGEDYRTALQTFDVKVFLVPGSDGTCRAVREALSSGIPVVSSDR
ncbi:MAG: glycosyltransferase family 4 protein, partial [Planctomycetota bacterium]|nr:glycosyltransferase family 4 protein [Planctomycetota bacterium]